MEFRHLKAFRAVSNELHFGRAAEKLQLDQSSLSRTIKELERKLDVLLFVRDRGKTILTKEGRALQDRVDHILFSVDDIKKSVRAIKKGYEGHLRIAISDYTDSYFFSEFLRLYREQIPKINIRIYEVAYSELIAGLQRDEYDISFSASQTFQADIISEKVCQDEIIVLLPLRHPLLSLSTISIKEIVQYPFISPHPEYCYGLYHQFSQIFHLQGIFPQISAYTKSYSTMLSLVSSGFGFGLASKTQYLNARSDHVVYRFLSEPMNVHTYLLHNSSFRTHHVTDIIKKINSSPLIM